MNRLLQFLAIAVWIAGALGGGPAAPPSASGPDQESMHLLVDTNHAQLGVNQSQVVLTVEVPGRPNWRVTAPRPEALAPNRPEPPASAPHSETAPPSPWSFVIHSLPSLL